MTSTNRVTAALAELDALPDTAWYRNGLLSVRPDRYAALRKLANAVRSDQARTAPATWTWDEIRTALDAEHAAWSDASGGVARIATEVLNGIEGRLAEQVRARGYRNTEDRS